MDANKIQVVDDQGNEKEFEVLFTFNNEELNRQYVLYYDASLDQPSVYASIYDQEGQLYPIETPEEWDLVEEVFQSFMSEDDCPNHQEGCHDNNHECCCQGDEDHQCCHEKNN